MLPKTPQNFWSWQSNRKVVLKRKGMPTDIGENCTVEISFRISHRHHEWIYRFLGHLYRKKFNLSQSLEVWLKTTRTCTRFSLSMHTCCALSKNYCTRSTKTYDTNISRLDPYSILYDFIDYPDFHWVMYWRHCGSPTRMTLVIRRVKSRGQKTQ